MIALGSGDMAKAYVGSTEVSKMYLGSDLVWENTQEVLPYDASIEYIQTDGTAYINTGIAPADITPIMEVRMYLPTTSTNRYPIGSDGSGNTRFSVGRLTSNRIEFRIGGYKNVGSKTANWYVIKLDGSTGEAYLNSTLQWTSTTSPLVLSTYPIYIFNRTLSTGEAGAILSGVRVSYYKLWDGDELLQDMIPVRVGQVGYLYDRVSGNFFGNVAGSGAFVLGNDIT